MASLKIRGQVKLLHAGTPMQNLKIELWDSVTDGYGLLGNNSTDIYGYFIFSFDDPIAALIADSTIISKYKIYKDGNVILEALVPDYTIDLEVTIAESVIDANTTDNSVLNLPPSFLTIAGRVSDCNGAPFVGITVNVYETVFPSREFIARTATDLQGNYSLKINRRLISNSNVLLKRGLVVESEEPGTPSVITTSPNLFDWNEKDSITVDLKTANSNAQPAYQRIVGAITSIIGSVPVTTLTQQQIEYLAGATGHGELTIRNLVAATEIAEEASLPVDYLHAFIQIGNLSTTSIASLKPADARRIITVARSTNLIQNYTNTEVDSFLEDLKAYQVQKTKETQISNESYTMNEVLDSIFADPADKDTFLSLYLGDFDSMPEFWNDIYIPAHGENAAKQVQQGLKLAAITSFQPQIMSRLKTEIAALDVPHVSQLAKWDQDTWTALISDVCVTESELCVPAAIRGEETDPENTAIQEQYALKLIDIIQRAYPLTNIAGVLEGTEGETIISDETTRAKVAAFVNNNPILDLRSASIHDINADDFDINEEDVEEVKEGLAPFQRLLRLVDGNPNAVCTMIADGVNSANAIAKMGKDRFLETYGDLFPPEETGGISPLYRSHVSSGGSFGLPTGGAVFGSAYAVTYTTSLGLTGGVIDSAYAGPALPGTFPGGFVTLPTDNPVLSSLFGSMDYCNCCDCKSILSPAAYLNDSIHFLKTHGGPPFYGTGSAAVPQIYQALIDKRPDIINVDLSCENSDTPLPYIDLVTELLELQILKPLAATPTETGVSLPTSLTIMLKPIMHIDPTFVGSIYTPPTPPTSPFTGYYEFKLTPTPGLFIHANPLVTHYLTDNPLKYINLGDYNVGPATPAVAFQATGTVMWPPSSSGSTLPDGILYRLDVPIPDTSYPDGSMVVWNDFSVSAGAILPGRTVTFKDIEGAEAIVAPTFILNPSTNGLVSTGYLIPNIEAAFVSATPTACTIKVTRSHAPSSFIGGPVALVLDWWFEALTGTPDPGGNPNITFLTLTPGIHKLGVRASYIATGDDVYPSSFFSIAIKINEPSIVPTYIPGGVFANFSFQTKGTTEQLLAYPERIYKDPYTGQYKDFRLYASGIPYGYIYGSDNLGGAVYPYNLPYSLAIDESRSYLQHMGISRFELMKLFKPLHPGTFPAPPDDAITDFSLYAEYFGLSNVAASIVIGTHPLLEDYLWKFYGFIQSPYEAILNIKDPNTYNTIDVYVTVWRNTLGSRLDILLQQIATTYEELLQLLSIDYINPRTSPLSEVREVYIIPVSVGVTSSPPVNTCKLNELKISFINGYYVLPFYDKLHRFIRLVRSGKMSIYQWDILLRSMHITNIDEDAFIMIGRVMLLAEELNIAPEVLACWWSHIDQQEYRDFPNGSNEILPSLYASVFSNKAVVNSDNINPFKDPTDLPAAFITSTSPAISYVPQVASMCGIEEKEIVLILNYFLLTDLTTVPVDIGILSRAYVLSALAKNWGYSIKDLITILTFCDGFYTFPLKIVILPTPVVSAPINNYLDRLQHITDRVKAIKASGFTIAEIDYIIRHNDPAKVTGPEAQKIKAFLEKIRTALKKQPAYPPTAADEISAEDLDLKLRAIIYAHFSSEFNMPIQWVKTILYNCVAPHDIFLINCIKKDFVVSTYSLSEESVSAIDLLVATPGTLLYPEIPGDPNVKPDFRLHSLYDWYRYFFKLVHISKKQKLRLREFEYLFFYSHGINFDFASLPAQSDANTITGAPCPPPYALLNGLLRISNAIGIIRAMSLSDSALGRLADAARGVISPAQVKYSPLSNDEGSFPPDPILSTAPGYLTAINTCFTHWLFELITEENKYAVVELIGDKVTSTGLTAINTETGVDLPTLLSVYFTVDSTLSNFLLSLFDNVSLLTKVNDILYWCKRIGMDPGSVHKLLIEDITLTDSRNLIIAAKGKYNDAQWAKVARPLRDTIRVKQRDALISYTLTRPNVIYGNLLIDVEMDTAMLTTRVKQAISSTQLLVDRVIRGLEYIDPPGSTLPVLITMPSLVKTQWEKWRKWYGIWHANREVFLYPENWMIPELRDDKSLFFEELEEQLKQDEVTFDKAEDAIKTYLHKLDDISRMEPVGSCNDIASDGRVTMHVVARTRGAAHAYYHRKLLPNGIWTPWGKIEMDITGNHVIPFVWNNRLMLFWLTFTEKMVPETPGWSSTAANNYFHNEHSRPMKDHADGGGNRMVYELTLNWTEYKKGKWQNQKASSDKIALQMNPQMSNLLQTAYANNGTARRVFSHLTNNNQIGMSDFIKSRVFLQPYVVPYVPASPTPYPIYSIPYYGEAPKVGDMYIMVTFPTFLYVPGAVDEYASHWEYTDYVKSFKVGLNDVVVPKKTGFYHRILPTESTFFKNQALVSYRDPLLYPGLIHDNLKLDSYNPIPNSKYVYDSNSNVTTIVKERIAPITILGQTPLNNYSIFPRSDFKNPVLDTYMYDDPNNTFFVRLANTNFAHLLSSDGSALGLASAGTIAEMAYSYGPDSPIPKYLFQTFYHPNVKTFIQVLNEYGLQGLMRPDQLPTPLNVQNPGDTMYFTSSYLPVGTYVNLTDEEYSASGALVINRNQIPKNKVDFFYNGAYSCYNWELFYHIPMLIADRLSTNQQFKEAQRWYHFIFDPTKYATTTSPNRNWVFQPFYQIASATITSLDDLLAQIHASSEGAVAQLHASADDPFQPYAIGRLRPLAFMKNTIMKYLDNLIAWGDQLFARDTIESINEATQLYILASNILGSKPRELPQRVETKKYSYRELDTLYGIDELGEASVPVETYIAPSYMPPGFFTGTVPVFNVSYFCLTSNDNLLKYWNKVESRLFKIRHSQNLQGKERQLPIYDPPFDPADLVKLAAQGIEGEGAVDNLLGPGTLHYRFTYMVQKANEFCGDVKALGGALLSALEKKDAEGMALLRQGHEAKVLDAVLQMKKIQITEAEANLEALKKTKENVLSRRDYYNARKFTNDKEDQHFKSLKKGIELQNATVGLQQLGAAYSMIPQWSVQAPFSIGPTLGGQQLSTLVNMKVMQLTSKAAVNNIIGSMASTLGGYERRMDDWKFQAQSAQLEADQLDKQISAANIRINIAKKEYENQQIQIDNSKEVDAFLRSKYTNSALYEWMIKEVSSTYYMAYQVAKGMAKKAEKCFENELPFATQAKSGFIKGDSWDSLKKGLLAGEKLQYDIRNMEAAYIANNKRTLELTKHISLAMLNADALLLLKYSGECNFSLPEVLYDLDYPNHYNRTVKSISISIPCIAGPYTTIPCTLSLGTDTIRKEDGHFRGGTSVCSSIATSSAQNDNGVFDFNFKDERYLPFEGAGAICQLNVKLGGVITSAGKRLLPFDFDTINDVIVHIKYTALEGDTDRSNSVYSIIAGTTTTPPPPITGLPRIFSLKHEFPNEWHAFINQVETDATAPLMEIPVTVDHFPFFNKNKSIVITDFAAATRLKGAPYDILINESPFVIPQDTFASIPFDSPLPSTLNAAVPTVTVPLSITETGSTPPFADLNNLDDIYLVAIYKVTVP